MRTFSMGTICLILLVAWSAGAIELEDKYPVKSGSMSSPAVGGDKRVGGDTVADAVPILALPYGDSGYTCFSADDYDALCHTASTSPDVVYSFVPATDVIVDIDLCGSLYDTAVFVLDGNLNDVACSDDYYYQVGDPCGQWNAKLEFLPLSAGLTYYIIVDGWGGECGDYELGIFETIPCPIDCPPDGIPEGESELVDGYDDLYNGGCIADWGDPLDNVITILGQGNNQAVVCGTTGFWMDPPGFPGLPYWDDDWYTVTAAPGVTVTVTVEAQRKVRLNEVTIPDGDCNQSEYLNFGYAGPCEPLTLTALGDPTRPLYFWVHGIFQIYPDYEFPYTLRFEGIMDDPVAIEATSWSQLKCIFR